MNEAEIDRLSTRAGPPRIMLDIETLSVHNSNAIVLSVGAVPWVMNQR